MIHVFDPAALSDVKQGWFAHSEQDGRAYIVSAEGAVPALGARALIQLDEAKLRPMGPDWFGTGRNGRYWLRPVSPARVGDNPFEGRVNGYYPAAANRAFLACGANVATLAGLDLDFVSGDALDPRVTVSGGINGTRFDADGLLVPATAPRFDHRYNEASGRWEPAGLLIEQLRTNLCRQSSAFETAAWNKTNASITANATLAPDGTRGADAFIENVTDAQHLVAQWVADAEPGIARSASIFVKAGARTLGDLRLNGSAGQCIARFDLAAGAVTALNGGAATGTTATITPIGGGWYRVTVSGLTGPADTGSSIALYSRVQAGVTYPGTGSAAFYLWGAQVEAGAFATSYIPTTAASVTRSGDSLVMTGANFWSWYPQWAGTMICEWSVPVLPPVGLSDWIWRIDNGAWSDYIGVRVGTGVGGSDALIFSDSTSRVDTAAVPATPGAIHRSAFAWSVQSSRYAVDGVLAGTDHGPITMPTGLNRLVLNAANKWLRRLQYIPARIPNASLQAVTAYRSEAPVPAGKLRIVPKGPYTAYVIAPHAELGAIAYELTLANGADTSTPPASIGAPFGGWRWTGTYRLESVESDPTSPIATLHQDIGSVDSALQASFGDSLFGGHYHGGIVLRSRSVPDLTTERYVPSFAFGYTATITWPTGEAVDVIYTMAIERDGGLSGSMQYSSSAAITRAFLSMAIANAFTHFSTDGGETWTDATSAGTYPLGSATGVIMRQGDTGYEIEVQTSGQDLLTGLTNEIVNNGGRLKHYVRKTSAGGPLGTVSLDRTIGFRRTEPDPIPIFDPITDTFDGSGDLPDGYARTHGPNGGTTSSQLLGGVWQVRAGASPIAPNRWARPLTGARKDGATYYKAEIDYNSIEPNTGMVVYLTRDGIGSTASGNLLSFNGGETQLLLSSDSPVTASMTFALPAGPSTPHLVFDASNIAERGVNISEIRITETTPPIFGPFHWKGSVDGATWQEVPSSPAVYLDGADLVLERGTDTDVAYHRAIFRMSGLTPRTYYRVPVSAVATGSPSAGTFIDVILSANGSTIGARSSDPMADAISRGYIEFATEAGQTTLYLMIRQGPQAGSADVLRVDELGPLAEIGSL